MKTKATLVDVARLSGVSRSMVSYVLNNFEDCKAKPQTKRRIMEAVKALDYHANASAKALRSGKSRQVGVVMPAPFITFYANMISLLQNELKKHGYTAIFGLWGADGSNRQEVLRNLVEKNFLAGIIAWDMEIPVFPGLAGVPVVLFSNYDSPARFDTVDTDIPASVEMAVEHLLSRGYRKIGYCGVLKDRRAELTARLLQEKGLPVESQWYKNCSVDNDDIYRNISELCALPEPPDALIFNNDLVAATACKLMKENHVPLPGMISFQDGSLLSFCTPQISAFDTRENLLAVALVDQLLRRMQKPKVPLSSQYVTPALIVRQSTPLKEK